MRSIGIALGFVITATPALADWQYTKWNMTPHDVVLASKGTVHTVEAKPGQRVFDADLLAEGTYDAAGFSFVSQFFFDASNRLRAVKLVVDDTSRCGELEQKLQGIYGLSENRDDNLSPVSITEFWLDTKNNLKARFTTSTFGEKLCFVIYVPLQSTGASGL
jgi:hypothetical protein